MPSATTLPRSMITIWSESFSASSMWWVVSTTETPLARRSRTSSQQACLACGSRPAVGSSRKTSSGRPMTAPASDTRCCWPPESLRYGVRACSLSPSRSSSAAGSSGWAWKRAISRSHCPQRDAGGTPPAWSITPTLARSSGRDGSSPSTLTVPPSARRNPSQISRVEVLPAPLGPSTAVTAPRAALKVRPSIAVVPPYLLTRSTISTAGESMATSLGTAPAGHASGPRVRGRRGPVSQPGPDPPYWRLKVFLRKFPKYRNSDDRLLVGTLRPLWAHRRP